MMKGGVIVSANGLVTLLSDRRRTIRLSGKPVLQGSPHKPVGCWRILPRLVPNKVRGSW